jgi:hypothetical protein
MTMSIHLEQEVADYSARRMRLAAAMTDLADWLDRQHGIDAERTLRLADSAASLKNDRLVVAFVAEFSRGKTELINALFSPTTASACCLRTPGAPPCARWSCFPTPPRRPVCACCR